MGRGILTDPTLALIGHSLDRLTKAQQLIGHNVANVDTPGYRAQALSFDATLANALRGSEPLGLTRTHAAHLSLAGGPTTAPEVVERDNAPRLDGNTVDINQEMVELVETGLKYRAVAQLASKRLALLKTIASES